MITTKSGRKVFDYKDVAELLGVQISTVRQYAHCLNLSLYTERGKVYFSESQLQKLAEFRNSRRVGRKKSNQDI